MRGRMRVFSIGVFSFARTLVARISAGGVVSVSALNFDNEILNSLLPVFRAVPLRETT